MAITKKYKCERILPHNWPLDIQYASSLVWDSLASDVKQKVCTQCIEDVEIKSHPTQAQFGLFAKKDLPKESIIGEFTGVVQQRMDNTNSKSPAVTLFLDESTIIEIDASKVGNETRFINDFRGRESEPNANLQQIRFGGCWYVLVVTTKTIETSQEILVDFGASKSLC